jgi:hypothetical protein
MGFGEFLSLGMCRIVCCILGFLTLTGAFGQTRDTLWVDEGYVVISRAQFEKKLRSKLYYSREYDLDTAFVQKLFLKYYLGRLEPQKKEQLYSILAQRNQMDTTQTMLIHYLDTLKSRDSYPKNEKIVTLKDGSHRHIPSYRNFIRAQVKCEKNFEKQEGIRVYHYFHHNEGHPTSYKNLQWFEDPLNLLRKLFYNKSDHTRMWWLYLYPNGDYMVLFGNMPRELYDDLKVHRNWEAHLKTFRETYGRVNSGT